jgi:hypothetical protein
METAVSAKPPYLPIPRKDQHCSRTYNDKHGCAKTVAQKRHAHYSNRERSKKGLIRMPTQDEDNEKLYATLDRLADQLYIQNEILADIYRIVHAGLPRKTPPVDAHHTPAHVTHKPTSQTTVIELPDLPVKRLKNS